MRPRLLALAIALVTMAVVLLAFFPLGCWDDDRSGPARGLRHGECPRNPSRIGVVWPNAPTGVVGAVGLSQLAGWTAGAYAWRRLVPRRRSRREWPG